MDALNPAIVNTPVKTVAPIIFREAIFGSRKRFILTVSLLVALFAAFAVYVWAEKEIDHANERHYLSLQLADELRQSSDDLSRMARTYVVTGDPIYKQYYFEILDIRNGKLPRPEHYGNIYWDLVLSDDVRPHPTSNRKIPLLDLFKQAGFADAELAKLAESEANSDGLTKTEIAAFALATTVGPDAEKKRALALTMLYDRSYMLAKAAIMKPIDDFYTLVEKRTKEAIRHAEQRAINFRILVAALGLLLVVMLWRNYSQIGSTLGGSVDEVYNHLERIGRGDFNTPISIANDQKTSVLGWLAETQSKLAGLEKKNQELVAATKRFLDIVQSSSDAIISKSLEGIITSWNPGAESIFGYSAEEMIGKPMLVLFPKDRVGEEKTILQQLRRGEKVDHFETVRLCKNGTELNVSMTISPIRDGNGNIIGASNIARDITEEKKSAELIWHQANFDRLTNLPNRSLFFDRLSKELSQARRSDKHVALLFLDLDGFKPINDDYGHEAGDIVLKVIAQRWTSCVREVDTVARLGGDEFGVIVGGLDIADEAAPVAKKLIQVLTSKIQLHNGQECDIGTSVGISIYPDNAVEMDSLLAAADAAMYQSKARGKNTYSFSSAIPSIKSNASDWITLDSSDFVGVMEIDEQHRHLVSQVNDLNLAISNNEDEEKVNGLFDELLRCTLLHIEIEHQLMQKHNYPDMASHDKEHESMMDEVKRIAIGFHQGNDLSALQMMKDWLVSHIRHADKSLGAFLISQGAK